MIYWKMECYEELILYFYAFIINMLVILVDNDRLISMNSRIGELFSIRHPRFLRKIAPFQEKVQSSRKKSPAIYSFEQITSVISCVLDNPKMESNTSCRIRSFIKKGRFNILDNQFVEMIWMKTVIVKFKKLAISKIFRLVEIILSKCFKFIISQWVYWYILIACKNLW